METKRKSIIFFSDLEGTLITENGEIDDENFYNFLTELEKLSKIMQSDIDIALVSPMGPSYMTKIMKEIDDRIRQYNRLHSARKYDIDLKSGAADFNDSSFDFTERIDRRIDGLKTETRFNARHSLGFSAKANYVKSYIMTKEANPDTANPELYIYAGNGKNDAMAMDYINKLKNGITICPANSAYEAMVAASIRSNFSGVKGIGDCIKQISEKILDKTKKEKTEIDSKKQETPDTK